MFVQVSHCPEATQAASDGTPLGGAVGRARVVGAEVVGAVVGEVGGAGRPPPVQAVPFRVKAVGAGLLPVHEPLKPNDALALVAREPL